MSSLRSLQVHFGVLSSCACSEAPICLANEFFLASVCRLTLHRRSRRARAAARTGCGWPARRCWRTDSPPYRSTVPGRGRRAAGRWVRREWPPQFRSMALPAAAWRTAARRRAAPHREFRATYPRSSTCSPAPDPCRSAPGGWRRKHAHMRAEQEQKKMRRMTLKGRRKRDGGAGRAACAGHPLVSPCCSLTCSAR